MFNIVPISGFSRITPLQPIEGTSQKQPETQGMSFGDILKAKIQNVKDLETKSLDSAMAIATGQSTDLESAMLDSAKASAAIEMTVQLTTRAVNAYKDILSMQI